MEQLLTQYLTILRAEHNRVKLLGKDEGVLLSEYMVETKFYTYVVKNSFESARDYTERSVKEISPDSFFNPGKKTAVYGKPGGGKTTFLKSLIFLNHPDKYPVFLKLTELAMNDGDSIFSYLCTELKPEKDDDLKTLLTQGRFALLLDGLDEVPILQRTKVEESIRAFSKDYSANSYVLTCRIAGYEKNIEGFDELEIADFSGKQIEQYIRYWFKENNERANILFADINNEQALYDLVKTPLLLILICIVFERADKIPSNKAELYEYAADILIDSWDKSRGIKRVLSFANADYEFLRKFYERLSNAVFQSDSVFFNLSFFHNNLSKIFPGEMRPGNYITNELAFLEELISSHGLLCYQSANLYSFAHKSLLEFFFSKHLFRECSQIELNKKVLDHSFDNKWLEITSMTLGLMEKNKREDCILQMNYNIAATINQTPKLGHLISSINSLALIPDQKGYCNLLSLTAYVLESTNDSFDHDMILMIQRLYMVVEKMNLRKQISELPIHDPNFRFKRIGSSHSRIFLNSHETQGQTKEALQNTLTFLQGLILNEIGENNVTVLFHQRIRELYQKTNFVFYRHIATINQALYNYNTLLGFVVDAEISKETVSNIEKNFFNNVPKGIFIPQTTAHSESKKPEFKLILSTDTLFKIFVSYAHKDIRYAKRFRDDLNFFFQQRYPKIKFDIFMDDAIPLGTKWHDHIQSKTIEFDIMILLVSSYFIASGYAMFNEFAPALKRLETENIVIVPVYLGPCNLKDEDLKKLQFFKPDGKRYHASATEDFCYQDLFREKTDDILISDPDRSRYMLDFVEKISERFQTSE